MRVKCSQRWSRAAWRRSEWSLTASQHTGYSCIQPPAVSLEIVLRDPRRRHADDHAVARLAEGPAVVLLRQLLDVLDRPGLVERRDAFELDEAVPVVRVDHD